MRCWLLVVGCWLAAGCDSGAGTTLPCGVADPVTGDVRACGDEQFCVCGGVRGAGTCAVVQGYCPAGYQFATGTMECLSPAQAAGLVPSTAADHPACPVAADADADADGGPDTDADAGETTPDGDIIEAEMGPEDAATDETAHEAAEDAVDDADAVDAGPVEIVVFAGEDLRSGTPDRRTVARDIGFPVPRPFERISLEYTVHTACPVLCDPLARVTTVRMETDGGRTIELLRAVTPFGADASWVEDITHLAPVLRLTRRVEVFIDTTEGVWEVDLRFVFTPGTPPRDERSAVPLFDETAWTSATNPAEQLVTVPADVTGAALFYRLTGHSTTGAGCDETCARTVTMMIDGVGRLEIAPWRDDCGDFVAANPLGDPTVVSLSRSGWCPADLVRTGVSDVSPWLTPGDHFLDLVIGDVDPSTGSWRASMVLVLYR